MTASLRPGAEGPDELLTRGEGLDPASGPVSVGFTLALLPLGGPEPCLRGVDQLLRAEQDAFRRQFRIEEVTLLQAACLRRPIESGGARDRIARPHVDAVLDPFVNPWKTLMPEVRAQLKPEVAGGHPDVSLHIQHAHPA